MFQAASAFAVGHKFLADAVYASANMIGILNVIKIIVIIYKIIYIYIFIYIYL